MQKANYYSPRKEVQNNDALLTFLEKEKSLINALFLSKEENASLLKGR